MEFVLGRVLTEDVLETNAQVCDPVGARNPVVAGQAALRYSLMSPLGSG